MQINVSMMCTWTEYVRVSRNLWKLCAESFVMCTCATCTLWRLMPLATAVSWGVMGEVQRKRKCEPERKREKMRIDKRLVLASIAIHKLSTYWTRRDDHKRWSYLGKALNLQSRNKNDNNASNSADNTSWRSTCSCNTCSRRARN